MGWCGLRMCYVSVNRRLSCHSGFYHFVSYIFNDILLCTHSTLYHLVHVISVSRTFSTPNSNACVGVTWLTDVGEKRSENVLNLQEF